MKKVFSFPPLLLVFFTLVLSAGVKLKSQQDFQVQPMDVRIVFGYALLLLGYIVVVGLFRRNLKFFHLILALPLLYFSAFLSFHTVNVLTDFSEPKSLDLKIIDKNLQRNIRQSNTYDFKHTLIVRSGISNENWELTVSENIWNNAPNGAMLRVWYHEGTLNSPWIAKNPKMTLLNQKPLTY